MKEPNEFTEVQKQLCQILTRNFFLYYKFLAGIFSLSKKYANYYQSSPFFIPPREI